MADLNPFVTLRDCPQSLSWKHLDQHVTYCFEMLTPFLAPTCWFKDKGTYFRVCCIVLQDAHFQGNPLLKDRYIVLDFPTRTFERAWLSVDWKLRNSLTDSNNVIATLKKDSRQSIQLSKVSLVNASQEQLDLARKEYARMKMESDLSNVRQHKRLDKRG